MQILISWLLLGPENLCFSKLLGAVAAVAGLRTRLGVTRACLGVLKSAMISPQSFQ